MSNPEDAPVEETGDIGSEPIVPPPIDESEAAPSTTGVVATEGDES
jgi:hypothetical protein